MLENQNATIRVRNDHVLRVTVLDNDDQPVDITGATIRWQLAGRVGSTSPLVSKATGGQGVEITDAENGVFEVTLDSADTDGLNGTYYHEAELVDAQGKKQTVMVGEITIVRVLIQEQA